MDSLRAISGSELHHVAQAHGGASGSQTTLAPLLKIFRTIPPERVGLRGEYDHSGLAKRVSLAFQQHFSAVEIENLRVSQRGTVVVLVGTMPTPRLLNRIVNVALSVPGAADVEINGTSVIKPLRVYALDSEGLSQASYAC